MADLPDTLNLGSPDQPQRAGLTPSPASGALADTLVREPSPASSAPLVATVPGYEITGELGRGGMGVVYKARQESLGRTVALKMLLAGEHAHGELQARFHAEAAAAARLQHANIVQVYEIGQFQGRPYFSLEFLPGGNLAERVRGTPQDPRDAAELMAVLALAVDFAHQHGIVHRDLKPANVLLAADGSPKIGDFGLAKQTGGSDLTRTGEILGTPSYMAPEQAQGGARDVGPLCDVYALGAILYELLAGRPPFRGQDPVGTMLLVCTAEPVPPRQLVPTVPRDLETIALKCLEKDPRRRFASAGELAADLRRYLDGQPILARPAGRLEVIVKWMRRRPATAVLLVGSLLAAIGFTTYSLWMNGRLRAALTRAEHQRTRAERNFRRVMGLSEKRYSQPERALAEELEFYQEILALDGDYPSDRYEKGLAARRSGDIRRQQQDFAQARRDYDLAAGFLEALVAEFPDANEHPPAIEYRRDLAAVEGSRGNLALAEGKFDEAAQAFRASRTAFRELARQFPREVDYARQYAVECNNLASALARQNQLAEAQAAHEEGLEVRRRLVEQHPKTSDFRNDLAVSLTNLGGVATRQGRPADAEKLLREAIAVRAEIPAADADFDALHAQATTLANLAVLLGRMEKDAESTDLSRQSVSAFEHLAREYPQAPIVLEQLADAQTNLAFRRVFHDPAEAGSAFRAAAALYKQLTVRYPQTARYPRELARQWCNVGQVEQTLGRSEAAEEAYRQAVSALRTALERGLDREGLAQARDLAALAGRADFTHLLAEPAGSPAKAPSR